LHGLNRLGIAVSGGADSVALFHLLLPVCREAGICVTVLHLNHGLRPESDQEVGFVQALATSESVPCLTETLRLAEREADGLSLEMAARAARQHFFARACREAQLDAVATGHQADDVAETLLLRLARGAGCSGLSGLRPRSEAAPTHVLTAGRPFFVIRPLLPVSGAALRTWLRLRGTAWCEDASNSECAIPRNLVRNVLLPQLAATWGDTFRPNLCRSAEILRSEDALLDGLAENRMRRICPSATVDVTRLLRQPEALRRRILRLWLFQQGLPDACGFDSVSRLLDLCTLGEDTRLQLTDSACAVLKSGQLRLARARPTSPPAAMLPPQGRISWGDVEIATENACGISSKAHGIGVYPAVCTLAAAALQGRTLLVRSRQPGDRIFPTGLDGSKKIQDLFVDEKVTEDRRDTLPLIVCGDEVVWVPGYRISRHFAVPASDAPSLRLTISAAHATLRS
jgi:tRNA(Ile)-lysidine synthase